MSHRSWRNFLSAIIWCKTNLWKKLPQPRENHYLNVYLGFPYRSSSVVILTWLLCNGTIKVAQFSFQRKSNKYLILEDIQLHRCFFSWDLHNEIYHIMLLKIENDTRYLFVLVKVFIVKKYFTCNTNEIFGCLKFGMKYTIVHIP